MSKQKPVVFDEDNPEWTEADFAKARPLSEFPELAAAFPKSRGRPPMPKEQRKQHVNLRLSPDVLAGLRATGPGWQTRADEILRKALFK